MELLVAPVEHITFDLEHALSQQLGKSYTCLCGIVQRATCGIRKLNFFTFYLPLSLIKI
jgi:hypothetical protein